MYELNKIKAKLKNYSRKDIIFNEPHFSLRLLMRLGDKNLLIAELLNPINLVFIKKEIGGKGDMKHVLYFNLRNTRTSVIPVIFDKHRKKSLYIGCGTELVNL